MNWRDYFELISAAWGLVGAGLSWLGGVIWTRRSRKKRLRALSRIEASHKVYVIIWAGGRSDPEPDVRAYLEKRGVELVRGLTYKAPLNADLSDPQVAGRLTEDLREMLTELGAGSLKEVHLFFSGMVAYAPLVGAMLANWCTVVVYHMKGGGEYLPLYRLDKEWIQASARLFEPLSSPTTW